MFPFLPGSNTLGYMFIGFGRLHLKIENPKSFLLGFVLRNVCKSFPNMVANNVSPTYAHMSLPLLTLRGRVYFPFP